MSISSTYAKKMKPTSQHSISSNVERLAKLLCLGFLNSNPKARKMKNMMICQWIIFGVLLYLWYTYNGELMPKFLIGKNVERFSSDVNLVDHFPLEERDGILISWKSSVNSKDHLMDALKSNVMMLQADVILKGQGSPNQQLVPIVANLPHIDSDLTVKEWLALTKNSSKGIKLHFRSIDAVDLTLQHLKEMEEMLHVPVHLSAAVLGEHGAYTRFKTLDAQRFIHLCKTHFPKSTVVLGWNTDSGINQKRYGWTDVKKMYDIIENSHLKQSVGFDVRARMAKNSISELKWLMEMTRGSVTLHFLSDDNISKQDVAYIRQRLLKHRTYYLLSGNQQENLIENLDNPNNLPKDLALDKQLTFNSMDWQVLKAKEMVYLFMGTESLLLGNGLLVTREEYFPSIHKPVTVMGRIEFVDAHSKIGVEIYLKFTKNTEHFSGVRCFINQSGLVSISYLEIPGYHTLQQTLVSGTAPCFTFKIIDKLEKQIELFVSRPKSCDNYDEVEYEGIVILSMEKILLNSGFLAIKKSDSTGFVAIDQFQIL